MEKEFLAKSNPKETIKEHTEKLIKCMDKFSKIYGDHFTKTELELIRIACQFHDIGKVNQVFQNKITGKIERNITEINHGCISGLYMDFRSMNEKYGEEYICALYTAIHYHHTREEKISPNEVDKYKDFLDNYTDTNMKKFLGQSAVYNTRWLKKLIFKYQCNDKSEVNIHQWEKYILIKGMLNKLDYAASAGISDIEEQKADNDNTLTKTINDKFKKTLLPAQQYMKDNCNENLIILAPTGTGKTEGALLWINNDKGFYTLPLKVASNSIYERIRDKYNYSKVALLHSDSIGYYIDEENGFQKYAKAKALSMPLTVCTVDQLFKFPFKALGTEIYPATLKYSKVIIDEIQMYSSTIIACLIIGLKIITDMGGKFAIITATLPPFIKTLINENIGETKYLYKQFTDVKFSKRHIIQIKGEELDLDKILESAEDKKVLVICNTVSKAQEIYKKLKSKNNEIDINLIHSRYIKKDRDELEKKILDFTTKDSVNKKGIWVSTQIVEASLDIDFDELHTEMCIADSLLQRVGRCYRAREYTSKEPNIYIYDTKNGLETIYNKDIYEFSLEHLKKYENEYFSEVAKINYINEVYHIDKIKDTKYYKDITEKIEKVKKIYPMEFDKKTADDLFRDINNINIIPEEVYESNKTKIDSIKEIINNKNIKYDERYRAKIELKEYVLSIYKFGKGNKYVDEKPYVEDVYRCRCKYKYDDEKTGLLYEKIEDNIL